MKLTQGESRVTHITIRSSDREKSRTFSFAHGNTLILTAGSYILASQDKKLMTLIKVYPDSDNKTLKQLFGE